jgi:uncharacterized protein YggT (Ycf19 family)
MNARYSFLFAALRVFNIAVDILQTMIFVWVILSWFIFFTHQSSFRWRHRKLYDVIEQIHNILTLTIRPLLRPYRRLLPQHKTGGIDWSPILLLLTLWFLQYFLNLWAGSMFRL